MKILISPAKSLDFQKSLPTERFTDPNFIDEAIQINSILNKKSPKDLQKLMNISEKLAQLNWERNQNFSFSESEKQKKKSCNLYI